MTRVWLDPQTEIEVNPDLVCAILHHYSRLITAHQGLDQVIRARSLRVPSRTASETNTMTSSQAASSVFVYVGQSSLHACLRILRLWGVCRVPRVQENPNDNLKAPSTCPK